MKDVIESSGHIISELENVFMRVGHAVGSTAVSDNALGQSHSRLAGFLGCGQECYDLESGHWCCRRKKVKWGVMGSTHRHGAVLLFLNAIRKRQ